MSIYIWVLFFRCEFHRPRWDLCIKKSFLRNISCKHSKCFHKLMNINSYLRCVCVRKCRQQNAIKTHFNFTFVHFVENNWITLQHLFIAWTNDANIVALFIEVSLLFQIIVCKWQSMKKKLLYKDERINCVYDESVYHLYYNIFMK